MKKTKILIAGIGGASLGTEIFKCLDIVGRYEIYGCDISNKAYGLYLEGFKKTFLVDRNNYIDNVLTICKKMDIHWLIPGGEEPMILLNEARDLLMREGISIVSNSPEVIKLCSDKSKLFSYLREKGVAIPKTTSIIESEEIEKISFPCIVKPATQTGGSISVFFATKLQEAKLYAEIIKENGLTPIIQEYISDEEGEFTIGVLSTSNKKIIGSIAMRRIFDSKLSVFYKARGGIISSGYSQGYIDYFHSVCKQAEKIANILESKGPINIQGRLKNGKLFVFEINPRFSASVYLRAMAGFNEVDILLNFLINGEKLKKKPIIKPGLYLRTLTEKYIEFLRSE